MAGPVGKLERFGSAEGAGDGAAARRSMNCTFNPGSASGSGAGAGPRRSKRAGLKSARPRAARDATISGAERGAERRGASGRPAARRNATQFADESGGPQKSESVSQDSTIPGKASNQSAARAKISFERCNDPRRGALRFAPNSNQFRKFQTIPPRGARHFSLRVDRRDAIFPLGSIGWRDAPILAGTSSSGCGRRYGAAIQGPTAPSIRGRTRTNYLHLSPSAYRGGALRVDSGGGAQGRWAPGETAAASMVDHRLPCRPPWGR